MVQGLELGRITADPYPDCSELDESEVVLVVLLVSGLDCSVVLDAAEEPLDHVAEAVKPAAEARFLAAI